MNIDEKQIDKLLDYVITVCDITCTKCDYFSSLSMVDDYSAAERFSDDGWHATDNHVYCPQCAKKYLKKKKSKKAPKKITVNKLPSLPFAATGITSFSPVFIKGVEPKKKEKKKKKKIGPFTGTTK
jgi:hypothetical protein